MAKAARFYEEVKASQCATLLPLDVYLKQVTRSFTQFSRKNLDTAEVCYTLSRQQCVTTTFVIDCDRA
jgi:hypothetical protein